MGDQRTTDDAIEVEAWPPAIVGQLMSTNELLRIRVLDLLRLMEQAVTERVDAECENDQLRDRVDVLTNELNALRSTKLLRWTTLPRSVYRSARGRRG